MGMKRLIGLAVLAVGLVVPTHAQTVHAAAGGGAANSLASGGGGWGGGGGLSGGFTAGAPLAHYPLTRFSMTSVSGSQQEFVPSVFVSYDKAVAEGQNLLDTPPLTVAEAARRQGNTHSEKAKIALVQDNNGKAVTVSR
jgi:hypothetical protein